MNILDLLVIALLILFVLLGAYQGFLRSVFSLGAFFLACMLAVLFSPLVSDTILQNDSFAKTLTAYVEGEEMIADEDAGLSRSAVSSLTAQQIQGLASRINLPQPLNQLVEKNLASRAFEQAGLTQVGGYVSQTIVCFSVNVFSLWIVFLITYVLLCIAIAAVDYAKPFAVLPRFDTAAGGLTGILLAFLSAFLLFACIPSILTLVGRQLTFINDMLENSIFAKFFYEYNIFYPFIKGI